MKQPTNKHNSKQVSQTANAEAVALHWNDAARDDLRNSFLLVSVMVNVAILVAYLVVQTTNSFDHQIVTFLLAR